MASATVDTFTYTGTEQTFTVPAGVTSVEVRAIGGEGGGAPRGRRGGVAAGVVGVLRKLVAGQTLYVEVGGDGGEGTGANPGGFNGGGNAGRGAGGGGGASDVRLRSGAHGLAQPERNNRVIVAAGGGGAGGVGSGPGGEGGGPNEGGGYGIPGEGRSGYGASFNRPGGTGFPCQNETYSSPYNGSLGVGGPGQEPLFAEDAGGGGGGGGYYGGGGACEGLPGGGGGGGGSSLVPPGGIEGSAETGTEPVVEISYPANGEFGAAVAFGPTGATGEAGAGGSSGARGVTGATGAEGATGAGGATGAEGGAGAAGATGARGLSGMTGVTGDQGATGATGPAGGAGTAGSSGLGGVGGVTGAAGAAGTTGSVGATGARGPEHIYSARSNGGGDVQTLSLGAPPGGDYVASFDAQASVRSPLRSLTCTLAFGSVVEQTLVVPFNAAPLEVYLHGDGPLAVGAITVTCAGDSANDSISNLSLVAYVGAAVN